jgi:hypothetical protein
MRTKTSVASPCSSSTGASVELQTIRCGPSFAFDTASAFDDGRSNVLDRPPSKTVRPVGRDVFRCL